MKKKVSNFTWKINAHFKQNQLWKRSYLWERTLYDLKSFVTLQNHQINKKESIFQPEQLNIGRLRYLHSTCFRIENNEWYIAEVMNYVFDKTTKSEPDEVDNEQSSTTFLQSQIPFC